MNPQTPFCHNPECHARGQVGPGNMRGHSRREPRYRGTICHQTFTATKATPCYRLRTSAEMVTLVLTLLSHGWSIHAMVAAFGCEERTVAAGLTRAGQPGQRVHQPVVQQKRVDLQHVQADELWVKRVGRRVWMAMALAGPCRLWLGGVISPPRDLRLIPALVQLVRACGRSRAIWVGVDGLASSVTACLHVFRDPVRPGRRGRPRLVLEQGWLRGQVVKRYVRRRVVSVERRGVRGTAKAIAARLAASGGGTCINTADLERLHATFRASLAPLGRRGRAIAHTEACLTAGMWLVGCAYNFCWLHQSLRLAAPAGAPWQWQECTPAMAAGLTDHRWTMRELMRYQVPLPPWVGPKRQGRPPKRAQQAAMALAA